MTPTQVDRILSTIKELALRQYPDDADARSSYLASLLETKLREVLYSREPAHAQ